MRGLAPMFPPALTTEFKESAQQTPKVGEPVICVSAAAGLLLGGEHLTMVESRVPATITVSTNM